MDLLDAFWHVANFFAPAIGVALISACAAKLLWRAALKGASWGRLIGWPAASAAVVLLAGLLMFGHDGRMATYAAMCAACALALWWVGFGARRH